MKNKFTQIRQRHGNKNVAKFKRRTKCDKIWKCRLDVHWSEELFMATTHTGTATFWSINCYVVVCTN